MTLGDISQVRLLLILESSPQSIMKYGLTHSLALCLTSYCVAGLLSSSAQAKESAGRKVWLESSFLTARPGRGVQRHGDRMEQGREVMRLEDQIF